MTETPDEWLERLFEFEYCAECGGDAPDHEVCLVPGMGTYFARCKRAFDDVPPPTGHGWPESGRDTAGVSRRPIDREA